MSMITKPYLTSHQRTYLEHQAFIRRVCERVKIYPDFAEKIYSCLSGTTNSKKISIEKALIVFFQRNSEENSENCKKKINSIFLSIYTTKVQCFPIKPIEFSERHEKYFCMSKDEQKAYLFSLLPKHQKVFHSDQEVYLKHLLLKTDEKQLHPFVFDNVELSNLYSALDARAKDESPEMWDLSEKKFYIDFKKRLKNAHQIHLKTLSLENQTVYESYDELNFSTRSTFIKQKGGSVKVFFHFLENLKVDKKDLKILPFLIESPLEDAIEKILITYICFYKKYPQAFLKEYIEGVFLFIMIYHLKLTNDDFSVFYSDINSFKSHDPKLISQHEFTFLSLLLTIERFPQMMKFSSGLSDQNFDWFTRFLGYENKLDFEKSIPYFEDLTTILKVIGHIPDNALNYAALRRKRINIKFLRGTAEKLFLKFYQEYPFPLVWRSKQQLKKVLEFMILKEILCKDTCNPVNELCFYVPWSKVDVKAAFELIIARMKSYNQGVAK